MSHQDWEPVVLKKKTAAKPKSTEDAVTQGARSGGGVALQTKHGAGKSWVVGACVTGKGREGKGGSKGEEKDWNVWKECAERLAVLWGMKKMTQGWGEGGEMSGLW